MGQYEYVRKTARYNGKQYEATGKSELEALTKLAEKLAAAKRGEDTLSGAMTVDAWYRQWFDAYKRPKKMTQKSLGMYTEKYNGYIKPAIGHMRLKDVKDIHLQRILNSQAGRSKSHVEKIRLVMRQMFGRARKSRLIPFDPAEDLELPRVVDVTHRSITEAERAAILAVAEHHDAGLWILTMLYTGMRPGETAALKWSDVDFTRNEIHIHEARESGSGALKGPKTDAGVRDIPIHSKLLPRLLEAHRARQTYVFQTRAGNRHNENSLRRLWTGFKRGLDIQMGAKLYRNKIVRSVVADDLVPYCLRHTFCTDLERAGVPINVAKELMGHSDIAMTANIYTHKDAGPMHAGISLLDGSAEARKEASAGKAAG